jgi:hypothetical protein
MSEKGQGRRPTVSEFVAVSAAYANEHPTGGALHIVVDDGNLEDSSVEFCYGFALEEDDGYGAALALLLSRMTRSQRGRVANRWYSR